MTGSEKIREEMLSYLEESDEWIQLSMVEDNEIRIIIQELLALFMSSVSKGDRLSSNFFAFLFFESVLGHFLSEQKLIEYRKGRPWRIKDSIYFKSCVECHYEKIRKDPNRSEYLLEWEEFFGLIKDGLLAYPLTMQIWDEENKCFDPKTDRYILYIPNGKIWELFDQHAFKSEADMFVEKQKGLNLNLVLKERFRQTAVGRRLSNGKCFVEIKADSCITDSEQLIQKIDKSGFIFRFVRKHGEPGESGGTGKGLNASLIGNEINNHPKEFLHYLSTHITILDKKNREIYLNSIYPEDDPLKVVLSGPEYEVRTRGSYLDYFLTIYASVVEKQDVEHIRELMVFLSVDRNGFAHSFKFKELAPIGHSYIPDYYFLYQEMIGLLDVLYRRPAGKSD